MNTLLERATDPVVRHRNTSADRRRWIGPTLILLLAVAVRLYRLPGVPHGLNQDEVSAGYETYSLLTHGTDRWGTHWPVYFTAFGSGQNVLQSYLNLPFLAVLGLTPAGVRLMPALLGVLTVGLIYALAARLAGHRAGLLAALLLAVCPWHVMMSRWSLESNMLPPFMLLAVWVLVVAYRSERRWLLPLSLAPMALAFYAYAAATVTVVLVVVAFLASEYRVVLRRPLAVTASVALFGLLALPYGLFLLSNQVLHRVPGWAAHLPFGIQLLPGNRLDEINHNGMLEHNFRFVMEGFDDHLLQNALAPYLPLGVIVIPLAAVGLHFALRDLATRAYVVVIWVIAALPSFFLVQLNINRINVVLLPLIVLAALGLDGILRSMAEPRTGRAVLRALLTLALLYNSVFVFDYFTKYNDTVSVVFSDGIDRALRITAAQRRPDEVIYLSDKVPLNYLYVLFDEKVDPADFRVHAEYQIRNSVYYVRDYQPYYFHHDDPVLAKARSYVAVIRADDPWSCSKRKPLARVGVFTLYRCTP